MSTLETDTGIERLDVWHQVPGVDLDFLISAAESSSVEAYTLTS